MALRERWLNPAGGVGAGVEAAHADKPLQRAADVAGPGAPAAGCGGAGGPMGGRRTWAGEALLERLLALNLARGG